MQQGKIITKTYLFNGHCLIFISDPRCWYIYCFNISLILGTAAHVSNVTHGPLVLSYSVFEIDQMGTCNWCCFEGAVLVVTDSWVFNTGIGPLNVSWPMATTPTKWTSGVWAVSSLKSLGQYPTLYITNHLIIASLYYQKLTD